MCETENLKLLQDSIQTYKDYPSCGVTFCDIFSITKDANKLQILHQLVIARLDKICPKPNCVVGIDARGFLLGPLIAAHFKVPFVPIRKKGKGHGKLKSIEFTSEYGAGSLEIQEDKIQKNWNVLVTDDLLATGGTLKAAVDLIQQCCAVPSSIFVLIEIKKLNGRCKLPSSAKIESLFEF